MGRKGEELEQRENDVKMLFLGLLFFLWCLLPGDPVPPGGPGSEIDHLAALRTKGAERIIGKWSFLVAMRTFDALYGAHVVPPANKYLQQRAWRISLNLSAFVFLLLPQSQVS
jgi:hypothetical protein